MDNYNYEYVDTFFDKVRLRLFYRKLRREKQNMLWESNFDKVFYETQFKNELLSDEDSLRKELAAQNQKPLAEQDKQKIESLEYEITHAKSVKMNYRKNKEFREEIRQYIQMLDIWKNSQ